MKRLLFNLLLIIFLLSFAMVSDAGTVSRYETYGTNSQVTSTNLNGNFNNILTTLNGGIDNTNIATSSGYRLFETLGALPSAGSQGRCVFRTTDNILYFDNGSAWTGAITATGTPAQGDVLYYDGTGWKLLTAGTSGYVLKTQGAGANPAWQMLGYTNIAWVKFQIDGTRDDNFNCTSITDTGAGDWTVNWAITFGNDDYVCLVTPETTGTARIGWVWTRTTTTTQVKACTDDGTITDPSYGVSVLALGD